MFAALISTFGLLAAGTLDIYWIDAEGGASTLIVTPSGQSMLVDSANRRPDDRDARRIHQVAKQAGLQKIDVLNGPKKGGPPSTFEILRKSPGLEDIWQGHLALNTDRAVNTGESMIANLEPSETCSGHVIKLSATRDGKYTITNDRNAFHKSYRAR